MNVLTQCSLLSLIYVLILVGVLLYCKYGKHEKLKAVLKEDIAFIALLLIIICNVGGFLLWLFELIFS